jgi:group I intron endonuclease
LIGYIYKITSPSGKIYVGQTKDPETRKKFYRLHHCKKQTKLYHSILKYGWDAHRFEIIETIPFDKHRLNVLEENYIREYKAFNNDAGLNLTGGGYSGRLSKESLLKIANAMRGRKISEATREKLREANLGKKQSAETIAKRVLLIRGMKRRPESCKKISEARKGMKFSESHIASLRNAIRPPVSDETKEKLRLLNTGKKYPNSHSKGKSKKVIDINTGMTFDNLVGACKYFEYSYEAIKCRMSGRTKTPTHLQWASAYIL